MEPEEALHFHILRRRKDGVEDWIDRSVEKIGAVPTLNEVLLPAMKEVGDKFGAGELILPFVLQSAEVMKRAVARLEHYLDKLEGYTKGTVVLATVFGDVHDIGKSLVNTILTNNGYTVVDLGKQVPIQTILDAAQEHDATAIGLSALLVSTSKQMPACIEELQAKGLSLPGADRRRRDQPRLRLPRPVPRRPRLPGHVRAGRLLLQGRLRGARRDGPADRRAGPRSAGGEAARAARGVPRESASSPTPGRPRPTTRCARRARTDAPVPEPPFWGVREIPVDLDEVYRHLDTHVLFKLHWGGRGVKRRGQWQALLRDDFRPRLERMWREQDYLHPRALLGLLPLLRARQRDRRARPRGPHAPSSTRFVCPRQPAGERICLADFFRPAVDGRPAGAARRGRRCRPSPSAPR